MTVTRNLDEAWSRLRRLYPDDTWFGGIHLEENRPRLFQMMADLLELLPPATGTGSTRVVDVGCYNGFLCYLLTQFGYTTAGIDALAESAVPERTGMLKEINAPYFEANFNELDPFPAVPTDSFDGAILGEVFEHILTHPVGFLEAVRRILRPGGLLILTTPNPLTLSNAIRVLRGQGTCWGDSDFAAMPKIDAAGKMISYPDIHYREYGQRVLLEAIQKAGFEVVRAQYLGMGVSAHQAGWKRLIKSLPGWQKLQTSRLFGMSNYVVCRRPA